jgi:hypothetical protein
MREATRSSGRRVGRRLSPPTIFASRLSAVNLDSQPAVGLASGRSPRRRLDLTTHQAKDAHDPVEPRQRDRDKGDGSDHENDPRPERHHWNNVRDSPCGCGRTFPNRPGHESRFAARYRPKRRSARPGLCRFGKIRCVKARAQWRASDEPTEVGPESIDALWAEIEEQITDPVALIVNAADAAIHAVVGDARGTVLLYFPPNYRESATGSLLSVGDRTAAERDEWEPLVTAYYFGHHTELPNWSLIPHAEGRRALALFCESPDLPPRGIDWEQD